MKDANRAAKLQERETSYRAGQELLARKRQAAVDQNSGRPVVSVPVPMGASSPGFMPAPCGQRC